MKGGPPGGGEGEREDGEREPAGLVGGDEEADEGCAEECAEGDLRDEQAVVARRCGIGIRGAKEVVGEEGERKQEECEVVEEEVVADEDGGQEREWKRRALAGSPEEKQKREGDGEDAAPGGSFGEDEERTEEVGHEGGDDAEVDLGGAVGGDAVCHGEERVEVGQEGSGAEDADGERGEEGSADEKARGEAPLSPEEKERGDGEGDLELGERERKDEAGEEVLFAAK